MFENLEHKALATVRANLVHTPSGDFFAAGGNQFRTLWVRDFCFAVPGLLSAGFQETVIGQLEFILSHAQSDGMLPRGLDEVNPKWRVVAHTVLRFLPKLYGSQYQRRPRPEFLGEHNTPAFDSGLLFLLALRSCEESGLSLSKPLMAAWRKIIPWFDSHLREGLLWQPPYSDWQDSVAREGFFLHTQLLYHSVISYYKQRHNDLTLSISPEQFGASLKERFSFLPSGLMEECSGTGRVSLDSHARILTSKDHLFSDEEKRQLWTHLKSSPLWKKIGVPVFPPYQDREISWTTKVVGLRHYHDGFQWGWLVAEAARTAYEMRDQQLGDELLEALDSWESSKFLSEIYERGAPLKKLLYKSESPFTWTAGKVLEALASRRNYANTGYSTKKDS